MRTRSRAPRVEHDDAPTLSPFYAAELDFFVDESRAVGANREYGRSLGWDARYFDIARRLLGVETFPITERDFAERLLEWQKRHCFEDVDGILGPTTWKEMRLLLGLMPAQPPKGPVRAADTPMPKYGAGFCCHKRLERRYGLSETIEALKTVGLRWQRRHGTRPRIRIADISLRGGGRIAPHGSHRLGIDVDLWLESAGGGNLTHSRRRHYSPKLTGELATVIRDNGVLGVHKVWYRDREVASTDYEKSHYRHLHVRFCMPARHDLAAMKRAAFPKGTKGSYTRC